jgi:hypothetical protein
MATTPGSEASIIFGKGYHEASSLRQWLILSRFKSRCNTQSRGPDLAAVTPGRPNRRLEWFSSAHPFHGADRLRLGAVDHPVAN